MRKLTLFLACMLMTFFSIGQVCATEVSITFSKLNLENGVQYPDPFAIDDNVSITFGGGGNDGKYYTTGEGIRTYGKGTITIKTTSGTISEVVFKWSGSSNAPSGNVADKGTYNSSTSTWSGEADQFTLTRPSGSGHWRLQGVTVTYSIPSGTPSCAKPTFLPAAGTYVGAQEITLSCETDGATIHYTLNGDAPDENSPEYTAAIPVSATTTIKAIAVKDQLDNSAVASATYKIIQHAGTSEDPYDIADARLAIDGNVGLSGVYMSGIISQITEAFNPGYGNISFDITADGSTTAESIRAYRCKGIGGADLTSENDVKAGATVTVYGNLTKYNSTYEFASGCYLTAYQAPAVQPADISNTKETAYTVSKALELANATNPPSDLSKHVFIKGVVYLVNSFNKGTYNIYIREAEKDVVDGNFEFFKCEGLFDETLNAVVPFEENGVLKGDTVIGYGTMTYYANGGIWEFSAGNYLVELHRPFVAVESVEISQPTAIIEVGTSVTLTAAVKPDNATNKEVVWSIESGADFIEFNDGVVTGIAEGQAVIRATAAGDNTKYAECTVTINAAPEGDYVTFDATEDLSEAGELSVTKDGFKLAFTGGAMDNKQQYRLYQNQTMTLSSENYIITKIEFTCTSSNPISGFADADGLDKENNLWAGSANSVSLTASNKQVRIEKLKVFYIEDTRADAGMAWEPALSEITYDPSVTTPADLGVPEFVMANAGPDELALVEFVSDNTDLITLNGGAISWNYPVTGTAHVTATFPGNDAFKPATVSCTIIINDATPEITTIPASYINFGSVEQGATINSRDVKVKLQNVAEAKVAISGEGAAAFSANAELITEDSELLISASSENVGTFAAILIISDNAGLAPAKEISLSLTVTEPVVIVDDDVTGTWTLVTSATTIAAGKKVIIAERVTADGAIYTMGEQKSNNRGAIKSEVAGTKLTPTVGTKVMTLADAGEGNFYLKTSDNQYLYNASGSKSYLKTKAAEENAAWSIEADANGIATIASVENENRPYMRYNYNGGSPLFNCYASGQSDIALYMLEEAEPEDNTYERTGLSKDSYYTICLPKNIVSVEGASFWNLRHKNAEPATFVYLEEATSLEAGKPYIFQAEAETLKVVLGDNVAIEPVENGALRGTFEFLSIADFDAIPGNIYILKNNAIRPRLAGENWLNANRAYIDFDALEIGVPNAAPGKRVRAIPMHENNTTDFENVQSDKVQSTKILINGHLYIMHNGTMYNVQGIIVK